MVRYVRPGRRRRLRFRRPGLDRRSAVRLRPPANPESTFDQHWLADLPADVVQTATIVGGAILAVAVVLMHMRLGGALRPVLLTLGWASALFLSLVLPGPQSLDAVPLLNLLNLKRLSWVTVHLVLLAYTGLALAAATTAYARATRGACVNCGRSHRPSCRSTPPSPAATA